MSFNMSAINKKCMVPRKEGPLIRQFIGTPITTGLSEIYLVLDKAIYKMK